MQVSINKYHENIFKQKYYIWPNILPTTHLLFKLQFSKFVKRYFHGTIVKIIYRMIDLNFMVVNFPCRKLNNSSSTATYSHVVSFLHFVRNWQNRAFSFINVI